MEFNSGFKGLKKVQHFASRKEHNYKQYQQTVIFKAPEI